MTARSMWLGWIVLLGCTEDLVESRVFRCNVDAECAPGWFCNNNQCSQTPPADAAPDDGRDAAADRGTTGDRDGDGIPDLQDNCRDVANPDQADHDNNGIGNRCESCQGNEECLFEGAFGECIDRPPCGGVARQAIQKGVCVDNRCTEVTDEIAELTCSDNQTCEPNRGCRPAGGCNDGDGDGVVDSEDVCPLTFNPDQNPERCRGCSEPAECVLIPPGDGVICLPPEDECETFAEGVGQRGDCIDGQCTIAENLPPMPVIQPCAPDGICVAALGCVPMVCDDGDGDTDGDGIPNAVDNCPELANPEQRDQDRDEAGDVCDDDRDGDGHRNDVDNCPVAPNREQAGSDVPGAPGDACACARNGDGCRVIGWSTCRDEEPRCGGEIEIEVYEGTCVQGRCMEPRFEEAVLARCAGVEACDPQNAGRCTLAEHCAGNGPSAVDTDGDGLIDARNPGVRAGPPVDRCPQDHDPLDQLICDAGCEGDADCDPLPAPVERRCATPGLGIACGDRLVRRGEGRCVEDRCTYPDAMGEPNDNDICGLGEACVADADGARCRGEADCGANVGCRLDNQGAKCDAGAAIARCVGDRCLRWRDESAQANESGPRYFTDAPYDFERLNDDDLLDQRTGLIWTFPMEPATLTSAHQFCESSNDGRRLASIYDLATLLPKTAADTATLAYHAGGLEEYLSRTVRDAEHVVGIDFSNHGLLIRRKNQRTRFACVRERVRRIKSVAARQAAFALGERSVDPWTGRTWVNTGARTFHEARVLCAQADQRLPRPMDIVSTMIWDEEGPANWVLSEAGRFQRERNYRVRTARPLPGDAAMIISIPDGTSGAILNGTGAPTFCMGE